MYRLRSEEKGKGDGPFVKLSDNESAKVTAVPPQDAFDKLRKSRRHVSEKLIQHALDTIHGN